jgi:serine/threonine protein kinase
MGVAERCDIRVGERVDAYAVEKTLGEGSFGKVFRVKDSGGTAFALKLFKAWELMPAERQAMLARFTMEYETGRIASNYLVHSVARGDVRGNPYIVMDFCEGGDLQHHVDTTPSADVVRSCTEVLYGLRDLHNCGKVHRDLKPENVLIKASGAAVLTDFGISGDQNHRMTKRGEVMGTIPYMAPEQTEAKRDLTVLPTIDIFAFGVMLYFLKTRALPFGELRSNSDMMPYFNNASTGSWNRATLCRTNDGALLERVIDGCLIPSAKKRLQTADEVLALMPRSDSGGYRSHKGSSFVRDAVNGILLRVMQGEEYGKVYKLSELLRGGGRIISVGRRCDDVHNALPIVEDQSAFLSRRHCTLEWDKNADEWYIRDGQWDKSATNGWRNSMNGTFVNSAEVFGEGTKISPGDIISIGEVKMRVEGY